MDNILFDYSKLRGKIREKCETQENFAKRMGMSTVSISQRLNNALEFSQGDMYKASVLLEFSLKDEVGEYFFTPLVQKHEQQ